MQAKTILPTAALFIVTLLTAARAADPVTVTEDEKTYTLDNGIVKAMVAKESGDLVSLRYKNLEMLATQYTTDGKPDLAKDPPGENKEGLNRGMTDHQYGFWSHDRPTGPARKPPPPTPPSKESPSIPKPITATARRSRSKASPTVAKWAPARRLPPQAEDFFADIEIRYALGKGDSRRLHLLPV